MKQISKLSIIFHTLILSFLLFSSCGPAVVGTAAVGTYKGATDTRTVGTILDDSVLSTKVKTALISEKSVPARKIDVDVLSGVVYLSGVVDTNAQKLTASQVARRVTGVRQVKNQLITGHRSTGRAMDDAVLHSRIRTRLIKEPGIRSLNIDVDVNQGRVTLTGTATSSKKKARILAIARSTPGTRTVIDNIKVVSAP